MPRDHVIRRLTDFRGRTMQDKPTQEPQLEPNPPEPEPKPPPIEIDPLLGDYIQKDLKPSKETREK